MTREQELFDPSSLPLLLLVLCGSQGLRKVFLSFISPMERQHANIILIYHDLKASAPVQCHAIFYSLQ